MTDNWIKTVVSIVETEIKSLEVQVEIDGKLLWNTFATIWATLAPAEWAVLEPIIIKAITDSFNGDFADLETAVLQEAEVAGIEFLKKLDSAALQAVLALFVKN